MMGRKNFYGSRSIDGADVAATIYSVIESCKKVELDPRNYLRETIGLCAEGKLPLTPFEFAQSLRHASKPFNTALSARGKLRFQIFVENKVFSSALKGHR